MVGIPKKNHFPKPLENVVRKIWEVDKFTSDIYECIATYREIMAYK